MRNTWYPQQKAEYVTASKVQGLKPQKLEAVRDFTFGLSKPEVEPVPTSTQTETVPSILTATRLLPVLLPTSLLYELYANDLIAFESYRDHGSSIAEPDNILQKSYNRR